MTKRGYYIDTHPGLRPETVAAQSPQLDTRRFPSYCSGEPRVRCLEIFLDRLTMEGITAELIGLNAASGRIAT